MTDVSLIVPFYNEENVLGSSATAILQYCRIHFSSYEVIFVDDGSTDGSRVVVNRLCKKYGDGGRIRVIGYTQNAGRGQAIRRGMEESTGDRAGYIDCDLEIRLDYLVVAIERLDTYDIVVASKFVSFSKVHTTAIRKISSITYNGIIRTLLGSRVHDHQAGLKFFRRKVIDRLLPITKEKGWLWDTEILYIAQRNNYSIYELPISITYGFRKMRGSFVSDFFKLVFVLIHLKRRLDKDTA